MVSPLRLALFAGAAALGAAALAAPASAQLTMPWGVWAGPPHMMQDEDDLLDRSLADDARRRLRAEIRALDRDRDRLRADLSAAQRHLDRLMDEARSLP